MTSQGYQLYVEANVIGSNNRSPEAVLAYQQHALRVKLPLLKLSGHEIEPGGRAGWLVAQQLKRQTLHPGRICSLPQRRDA